MEGVQAGVAIRRRIGDDATVNYCGAVGWSHHDENGRSVQCATGARIVRQNRNREVLILLTRELEHTVDARDAWLIQAALFSVLHPSPIVFPSHFVMGLVFGYLRLRSRSLYPGMVLHTTWNALVLFAEI